MEVDEELDNCITELNTASQEIDSMFNHIEHLMSWGDFLEQCKTGIDNVSVRLDSIEFMAESCSQISNGIDINFSIGVCWIGAVATYEGYLHNLLLNALSVSSLQERITEFCQRKIDAGTPPRKGMKNATSESIREWLTSRTITDPRKLADNFDEIFGIRTMRADDEFCDRLLKIRNSFTHRGGLQEISLQDLRDMTKELNNLVIAYTQSLTSEVDKILKQAL